MRTVRKAKKKNRIIIILIILLVVVGVVTLAAFVGWKVFTLEKVDVVGNEIYSDEQIEDWVMSSDDSWNTLYVLFRNRTQKQEEIPFVDSMDIEMVSPKEIQVNVTEKGVLGYVYIPTLGQNAYFDQDGFIVEISGDVIDGVTKISGLQVENAQLYEKLNLTDSSILKTLLSLTQLTEKYNLEPEVIYIQDKNLLLSYGDIQVDLGTGGQLNEKILRLVQILPQLGGETGTLHMDKWSETNADIYFTPDELTVIPVDQQMLSASIAADI